ncbi:MAG TPA: hypothetical protein DCY88_17315 [Cyanobacteria bacterium UBA11372]|nr:hypothetical protein [Cyanobacteria bacterium UBA11372]
MRIIRQNNCAPKMHNLKTVDWGWCRSRSPQYFPNQAEAGYELKQAQPCYSGLRQGGIQPLWHSFV